VLRTATILSVARRRTREFSVPESAMPTNRGNGYDVFVAGDGRGRDAKGARQGAGPQWGAPQRLNSVPVPGKGIAGYSRELLKGALVYAGRGIPVFPCEGGGKRPLTVEGFLEATTEEARIRGWWGRWPNANVAIPTGEHSGLLVLDVDSGEGTDSVALLELARGQAPKTARAATGGGGMHLYFRYVRRIIRRWIPLLRGERFGRTVKDN
jgi:hypothetical protein